MIDNLTESISPQFDRYCNGSISDHVGGTGGHEFDLDLLEKEEKKDTLEKRVGCRLKGFGFGKET